MQFRFDANQEYQAAAVEAAVNLFEGQPNGSLLPSLGAAAQSHRSSDGPAQARSGSPGRAPLEVRGFQGLQVESPSILTQPPLLPVIIPVSTPHE